MCMVVGAHTGRLDVGGKQKKANHGQLGLILSKISPAAQMFLFFVMLMGARALGPGGRANTNREINSLPPGHSGRL